MGKDHLACKVSEVLDGGHRVTWGSPASVELLNFHLAFLRYHTHVFVLWKIPLSPPGTEL